MEPTSPPMSPGRRGKYIAAQVHMLDDTVHIFHIPHRSTGRLLYEEVVRKLQLLEADYFDLEYRDANGSCYWLDQEKAILKQMSVHDLHFLFLVKFYTPDPGLLEEEYTRYLFALQVKRDLATGAMPCQEHTAVLLASYIAQAEIGDFLEDEYIDHTYLSQLRLLPNQTEDLDIKIREHHREHIGQTPAEADFNLLDTARKVELYGIRLHPAKDHEGVALHLAVAHMGVLVFQSYTKINTFSWAKVRKLSFKRKKFLIKLHPEGYGYYKDTVEFYFDSRNESKNFWKKCIEHHAFFRCHSVKKLPRNKTRVVSRGSSFRYSGRTQKQLVEYVRENFVKRPHFERSTSMRTVSTSPRSAGATPKSGTLNSHDLHNASASSGSRSLGHSKENMLHDAQHYERAQVHDDTSPCSRSLGSPRSDPRHQPPPSYADLEQHHQQLAAESPAAGATAAAPPGAPFNHHYYQLSYEPSSSGVQAAEAAAVMRNSGSTGHLLTAAASSASSPVVVSCTSSKAHSVHEHLDQNANDNDDISHDSYLLTESRGSLDGGLDSTDELDDELHIDEERLMGQLQREVDEEEEEAEREEIHVVRVQPEAEVYDRGREGKQVEIEIVENVQTTQIIETVERSRAPRKDSERGVKREASEDSLREKADLKEELRKEEMNGEAPKDDDIPYILHRRMVKDAPERRRAPRSLPAYRSPSPGRPAVHLTRDEKKAQLDKIKCNLTSPMSPKSPREKSPARRGFDVVTYTKLPAVDSFSSKDDTVSPTQEDKDLIHKLEHRDHSLERVVDREPVVSPLEDLQPPDHTAALDLSPLSDSDDGLLSIEIEEEVNRILSDAGSGDEGDEEEEEEEEDRQNRMTFTGQHSPSSSREKSPSDREGSFLDEDEEKDDLDDEEREDAFFDDNLPRLSHSGAHRIESYKIVSTSSEEDLPPPPPLPPPLLQDLPPPPPPPPILTPPEEETSEDLCDQSPAAQHSCLPIPAIVVRAASPIGFSSSDEEPLPTSYRPPPSSSSSSSSEEADDFMEEIELRIDEERLMQEDDGRRESFDLPPPPPPPVLFDDLLEDIVTPDEAPPHPVEFSSDDDVAHNDSAHREEHADVVEALRAEASANPYRIPRKASEDFPGPPDFDVSSEESDSDVFRPGLGDFDDAGSILASHAESQPYSVLVPGGQHFPAPPEISSEESDNDQKLEMGSDEAHAILAEQALAMPFSVPMAAGQHFPAPPDISSEESDDDPVLIEMGFHEADAILMSQAVASPFSVPYSCDQQFPAPPDISSEESDDDNPALELESFEAHEILRKQALERPFSIPYDAEQHFPAPPDISSEESDDEQPQIELGSAEADAILQSQADANPFSVLIPGAKRLQSETEADSNAPCEANRDGRMPDAAVLSNPYSIDRASSSSSSSEEDEAQEDPYDVDDILESELINMPFRGPRGIENHPFPPHPLGYAQQYSPDDESDHLAEFYQQLGLPQNPHDEEDSSSSSSLDNQLQALKGSSSGSEAATEEFVSLATPHDQLASFEGSGSLGSHQQHRSSRQQKSSDTFASPGGEPGESPVLTNPYAGVRPPTLPKPKILPKPPRQKPPPH